MQIFSFWKKESSFLLPEDSNDVLQSSLWLLQAGSKNTRYFTRFIAAVLEPFKKEKRYDPCMKDVRLLFTLFNDTRGSKTRVTSKN